MPGKRSPEARQRRLEREARRQAERIAARERAAQDTDDFRGVSRSVRAISQQSGFKVGATGFRVSARSRSGEVTHVVREARTERTETADAQGNSIEVVTRTALVPYAESQLKRQRERGAELARAVSDEAIRTAAAVAANTAKLAQATTQYSDYA